MPRNTRKLREAIRHAQKTGAFGPLGAIYNPIAAELARDPRWRAQVERNRKKYHRRRKHENGEHDA